MSKFQPIVLILALSAAAGFGNGNLVWAQQPATRAADEAEVRKAGQDYLAAMERGDGKAIAEFWTSEGTYTDEHGQTSKARELIQKSFVGDKLARPQMKVSANTVRFIADGVALEEGVCETTPPSKTSGASVAAASEAPLCGRFTALWVKQNGKWKLESLRESRDESIAAPPSKTSDSLSSLEPLVGQWSGSSGKLSMQMSARWNSTKTFLHREVSVSSDGKPVLSGTQEIGRDPLTDAIKSWVFNSDGSHGEGVWSLEGNSWMVLAAGVSPNGQECSSRQTFKFLDKDTLVWKMKDASLSGQPLPNLEFTLKRKAAAVSNFDFT
jgi:uncharacterized protein (TIGR02246 family)